MKDSDSNVRSSKKSNGRTAGAKLSSGSSNKSNGSTQDKRRTKKTKTMMGASSSRTTKSTESSSVSPSKTKKSPRKGKKESPELRPRRRASQTYFFKYQLAKNPLKAEEEDLKLALLASLQQCNSNGTTSDNDCIQMTGGKSKTQSKKHKNSLLVGKRPVGRPPKNPVAQDLVVDDDEDDEDEFIDVEEIFDDNEKKEKFSTSSSSKKASQQFKIVSSSSTTTTTSNGAKRRGSVESNPSSRGSSYKDEAKKVIKKYNRRRDGLLQAIDRDSKTDKPRNNSSIKSCNDLTSVQNKIKKAKKLLQNKQANKNKSNALIGKYSALRKFASNSNSTLSTTAKHQGGSLLMSPTKIANKSKSRSKLNDCYCNDNLETTGITNTTSSNHQYFMPHSPYTPLQRKEPPDEDYLRKYKPETEDFLTFICFRTTAPNKTMDHELLTNGQDDSNNNCTTPNINFNNSNNNRITDKQLPDPQNLKQCTSTLYKLTNINNSPTSNDHYSPNNHRRPTRQSPRLASSNRKISENESSNHTMGTSATAYDNSITYEEDMKRASIALEDMAQEINSSDDIHNEVAQNSPDCISKLSSPYKNNKHLVKGLMTREFAGAFADEDTIFESISNHKL